MIKIWIKYLKPYIFLVFLCVIVLFGQAIAELSLPNLMSDIVNDGMVRGNITLIYRTGSKMLAVTFGSMTCAIIASFLSSRMGIRMGCDIRKAAFKKVEHYSLYEFENIGTASLITRITNDIVQLQQVTVMAFRFIIYSPIMCIGGMYMALSKDKALSVIFAVIIPVLLGIVVVVGIVIIPSFTIMQKRIDKLNLTMRESLMGIRVIRAFNKMDYEKNRFKNANKDLIDVSIKVNRIMAMLMPIMMFFMNATILAIIWFGGVRVSKSQMAIGDMMAFMQYAMQIIFSILMIAVVFVIIPRAQASAVRVHELLDSVNTIKDPNVPKINENIRGKLEFRRVSFQYQDSERPVLEDISFTSNAGETTAIIGGTGSGKSTVINLIPRFYDVSSGSILVDDINVKEMEQESLRKKIGFVPQGAILFSGTVNENIRFGKKDATDEEIEHATKVAQAYDFVSKMPEKFNTFISQGGTNVSGGQKQRISIARAIVRNPEIYVFDDSFSALDFKTDATLRSALKKETSESTVIIVAQRVSSIMDADRIIVLDEGKIAGIGKHRDLLNSCSVYREICSSQLSEEELA